MTYFNDITTIDELNTVQKERKMKKCKKFISHPLTGEESKIGEYYEKYDPQTGAGEGWFGSEEKVSYLFEYVEENGILYGRTCGIGEGCFWTDWQDLGPVKTETAEMMLGK